MWKAWLDAHTVEASQRVCKRIEEKLGLELHELKVEPYHKGGHVVSWVCLHEAPDAAAFMIDVIGCGQQIASGWRLGGSVHDELEGLVSRSGGHQISVSGITMLTWRAPSA
jgi:hypothetical protein